MRGLPVIEGAGVKLRPWTEEDAPRYVAARDEEIFRWTTERRDLTVEEARESIRRAPDAVAGWAVVDPEGEVVGNLALARTGPGIVEVSYWMAAPARGRGWATEAVRRGVAWAERALGAQWVEAVVHPDNVASRRVLEKVGFRMAGWRQSEACCAGPDGSVVLYRRSVRPR